MEFHRRFLPVPTQSFFLFGPRGTGKSTWLRHPFPDALVVDLLQPDIYREMSACPERLIELVQGSPQQHTVVMDEVQLPVQRPETADVAVRGGRAVRSKLDGGELQAQREPWLALQRPSLIACKFFW